jgi:hypothetical protein
MRLTPTLLASLFALVLAARGQDSTRTVELFNGKDLSGWSLVTPEGVDIASVCHVTADGTMAVAGKPIGYLLSDANYPNYWLHAEWRWPANAVKNSNSGFLVYLVGGPVYLKAWPVCVQVQTKLNRAGDLLPMAGATFAEPLSTPPGARTPQLNRRQPPSEKPLGEWNYADIICRDGAIQVSINGVFQNQVTGCKPGAGKIGIQLEGFPYELRNLWLQPLP